VSPTLDRPALLALLPVLSSSLLLTPPSICGGLARRSSPRSPRTLHVRPHLCLALPSSVVLAALPGPRLPDLVFSPPAAPCPHGGAHAASDCGSRAPLIWLGRARLLPCSAPAATLRLFWFGPLLSAPPLGAGSGGRLPTPWPALRPFPFVATTGSGTRPPSTSWPLASRAWHYWSTVLPGRGAPVCIPSSALTPARAPLSPWFAVAGPDPGDLSNTALPQLLTSPIRVLYPYYYGGGPAARPCLTKSHLFRTPFGLRG